MNKFEQPKRELPKTYVPRAERDTDKTEETPQESSLSEINMEIKKPDPYPSRKDEKPKIIFKEDKETEE